MKCINIGMSKIGLDYKPYFIADIAANHDGDINRAFKLIELAKKSGADAAKFQNFTAKTIVSRKGFDNLDCKMSHQSTWKKSVFEVYEDASIPQDWSYILKEKCDEVGIEYMTSPYDFQSVDNAEKYLNAYKIGSGDITWIGILDYIAQKGKPVILATGASDMQDVKRAVKVVEKYGKSIVLMQCNTNYTASKENFKYINLNVLKEYRREFPNVILGLSDHTPGHSTVLGAISLGARVIEKHFTDDNDREGPDHRFSMIPSEWREMVDRSEELFYALGDGIKKIEDNETETALVQRRAIYYKNSFKKGHILKAEDIVPLRPIPRYGLPPYKIDEVIGKVLIQDVDVDNIVKIEDIM